GRILLRHEPLGQAQDIFFALAFVLEFIHVVAKQLDAPTAGRIIFGRRQLALDPGRIEVRAAVAQFDKNRGPIAFEADAELLGGVAFESVIDDIAGAFLEGQREVKDGLFGKALGTRKFAQSFDAAHAFFGGGVQFQRHEPPSRSPFPFTFSARIAISSDCGAVPANARTFWSSPLVIALAVWPPKAVASASNRSLP